MFCTITVGMVNTKKLKRAFAAALAYAAVGVNDRLLQSPALQSTLLRYCGGMLSTVTPTALSVTFLVICLPLTRAFSFLLQMFLSMLSLVRNVCVMVGLSPHTGFRERVFPVTFVPLALSRRLGHHQFLQDPLYHIAAWTEFARIEDVWGSLEERTEQLTAALTRLTAVEQRLALLRGAV